MPRYRLTLEYDGAPFRGFQAQADQPSVQSSLERAVEAFTGEGMPSGDTDPTRAALVERGRKFIVELTPLLAENGLPMHYPTLIWQDAKGRLRGCACEEGETYSFFRKDIGVPG